MKAYNLKLGKCEQKENWGPSSRSDIDYGNFLKRRANKLFRKTGKGLVKFEPGSITTPNYRQRSGYEL